MDAKIKNLALALYHELEDQNYQSLCTLINWAFDIYPDTNYYSDVAHMLQAISQIVRPVKVRSGLEPSFQDVPMKLTLGLKTVKK